MSDTIEGILLKDIQSVLQRMSEGDYRDTTEVAELIHRFRALPGNELGGNLHIVLDDNNLDDTDISWCRGFADAKGDRIASQLSVILEGLSVYDRVEVVMLEDDMR